MLTSHEDFTSVLLRRKVVTPSQMQGAQLLQRQTKAPLGEVLVEFGYASREQVLSAMFVHCGDDWIDLTRVEIPREIIARVPESVAREHTVIPIAIVDGVLQLAMADPDDMDTLAKLLFILDDKIQPLAAPKEQILACINRHYGGWDQESVDELIHDFTSTAVDFELSRDPDKPRTVRGQLTDSDSEFELALGEEKKDVFETDFDPDDGSASQVAAMDEEDSDLGSSEFDLGINDVQTKGETMGGGQAPRTQLAMDDAARDEGEPLRAKTRVYCENFDAVPAPAAARPVPAAAAPATFQPRGVTVFTAKHKTGADKPMVERQATIRYYSQMAPERMFPLLVVISRKAILEVVKQDVVQKQSKKFTVQMDSTVEIEPILPGCDCFPPKETAQINASESSARFWVVPRVLGEVMHARVIVRQNGNVLAEVPLEMHVAKQTLTLCVGAMNFCVPFVSMLLKQSQLSLTSSEGGSGLLAALVGWLLVMLSPEVMAGLLLLATVGLYFWLRPRQRDVFWDIQPAH